jgi:hypothetical protein
MKIPESASEPRRLPPSGTEDAAAEFTRLAGECLGRFLRQNDRPALPAALHEKFLARLWSVVTGIGLPRPLAKSEQGTPTEMSRERTAGLIAQVMAGLPFPERHPDLDVPARQLLKACLQPEFRSCRDSYKEVVDGACRRQELARTRGRISGAHCVDCPYWVALRPEQHAALLAQEWVAGGVGEFAAHVEIFLPEDFRALRVFLWRRARSA